MSRKKKWSPGNEAKFKPTTEVLNFFESVSENKLKEAEDKLNLAIQSLLHEEYDGFIGYQKGLEGILLSLKEKNKSTYFSEIILSQKSLKKAKKEFSRHMKDRLHASYDRWYFKALFDYNSFLLSKNYPF